MSLYFQLLPCLSRGWLGQDPGWCWGVTAGGVWAGIASPPGAPAPPHPVRMPALFPAETWAGWAAAEVIVVWPGPTCEVVTLPGALKEVGVGKGGPCSAPWGALPPLCKFPIKDQPAAWFKAAATNAGFMGRAPMLRPAIGLLPDWPPPDDKPKAWMLGISIEPRPPVAPAKSYQLI